LTLPHRQGGTATSHRDCSASPTLSIVDDVTEARERGRREVATTFSFKDDGDNRVPKLETSAGEVEKRLCYTPASPSVTC